MRAPADDAAPASLDQVVAAVDELLGAAADGERTAVVVARAGPVARLGLALDPPPDVGAWARAAHLDALLLHRHWRLEVGALPPELGVLASHAPLDEGLGLGWNARLAARLGDEAPTPIGGTGSGAPGMLVRLAAPTGAAALLTMLAREFGGVAATVEGAAPRIACVATARAMTDALVREAAARGAECYVTGELRRPAEAAVRETGLHVVAVGHARQEAWSLALLARLLGTRWPALACVLPPAPDDA